MTTEWFLVEDLPDSTELVFGGRFNTTPVDSDN